MDAPAQTPLLHQDRNSGLLSFCQRRSVLFWIEPSLNVFLRPLIDSLGESYYYLLVAYAVSKGAAADYEDIIHPDTEGFAKGFRRWFEVISLAGWGALDRLELAEQSGESRVFVIDPWELLVHRTFNTEDNLPFLCGKLSGIFSHFAQRSMRARVTDIDKHDHHLLATIGIRPSAATFRSELEEMQRRNGITEYQRLECVNAILKKTQEELSLVNARLEQAATHDDLTGLYNRRYFLQQAAVAMKQARRYTRPLSLLMLDVDHLKQINDNFGHQAGDALLRDFADICRRHLRETDLFCRVSGDEFTILLPETGQDAGMETARKLLAAMAAKPVRSAEKRRMLSASIGVVQVQPDDTLSSLLRRADDAMYEAKRRGRNQAVGLPEAAAKL